MATNDPVRHMAIKGNQRPEEDIENNRTGSPAGQDLQAQQAAVTEGAMPENGI